MRRDGGFRWGRCRVLLILLAAFPCGGCGGGGDGAAKGTTSELGLYTEDGLSLSGTFGSEVHQILPMLLVPSAAAANGIVLTPDTSPGAAPNTYLCQIPLDLGGDGTNETVVDATLVLNGDLFTFGPGFGGTIEGTITRGGAVVAASLAFRFPGDGEIEISGTVSLAGALSGIDVTATIDAAAPIVVKVATGGAGSIANVCTYSVSGDVRVEAARGIELFSALWTFSSHSRRINVSQVTRVDDQGVSHDDPDSSFEVPCENGAIADWGGTYDFDWFCNPQEEGDSVFVITVTGPNTIHVDDEGLTYDATAVPGNPHVVTGFFIDQGYREDFVWTLSRDGTTFTQQSVYVFLPPLTGGGVCGGIGTRRP